MNDEAPGEDEVVTDPAITVTVLLAAAHAAWDAVRESSLDDLLEWDEQSLSQLYREIARTHAALAAAVPLLRKAWEQELRQGGAS